MFGHAIKIPAYLCKARTAVAEKFVSLYGEVLSVKSFGHKNGNKLVIVTTGYGKDIEVQLANSGEIIIDGVHFADGWNEVIETDKIKETDGNT